MQRKTMSEKAAVEETERKEKEEEGNCMARGVLAIQASTVASESSISVTGRIISDHRSRLKSDTVDALICLQDWLKAVGMFF
jgi:hypothetical protein